MKRLQTPESPESVLYTSLSLFIILLAFFMVLASYSAFDEKRVRPILDSLEQTFTTRVFSDGVAPNFVEDPSRGAGEGFVLEDLSKLFKAEAAGIEPQLIPSRGILSLEIPNNKFIDIVNIMKAGMSPTSLSATLLRVLKEDDTNKSRTPNLQMEIWLRPEDKDLLNISDGWMQNLIQKQIDSDRMSLGFSNAVGKGKVLLLFRPYSPYEVR
jgi:hypothetical protein